MGNITQPEQVIEAMRNNGGYATLRKLNEIVDFSNWGTKTPEASVRRIVQKNNAFFRLQPGLWALEEYRNEVLKHFEVKEGNKKSEERFTHGYYQGLLVEIGKFKDNITYVPAQDKGRVFMEQKLGDVADLIDIPHFTYDNLLRKARTVDVIWFNRDRYMPSEFFEVEHTTDIKSSLLKFYELQDFYAKFNIVADASRENEFKDKINSSIFKPIKNRVLFRKYNTVLQVYEGMLNVDNAKW